MKTKIPILALVLALFLAAAGVTLADDGVELPRWVLGGGASDSASGDVALRAALGQPVVGVVTGDGGDVILGQGFWHGGGLVGDGYDVYLPLVRRQ
jgi:hypothetical protein